jgi:hypothetical protein
MLPFAARRQRANLPKGHALAPVGAAGRSEGQGLLMDKLEIRVGDLHVDRADVEGLR